MQNLQPPKGTRDQYPEDYSRTSRVLESWEKTCRLYGFERYDGPMFEHLELYTQKSGDEIEKQLYAFKDKGGRDIALRPEITPTLARMVASRGASMKMPLRWYSMPTLFRYERMQKGRLREFIQLNMDIIGIPGVSADAELIAAAVAMMQNLGFDQNDFSVRISSRKILEELLIAAGAEKTTHPAIFASLDHKHKTEPEKFAAELTGILGSAELTQKVNEILEIKTLDEIDSRFPGLPSTNTLKELFRLLGLYGMQEYLEFDIGIVRGLAYYTGIVFELFDKLRSMRAIAGGGRYDGLISLYGGPETPAVGFAAGDVVLGDLMDAKNISHVPNPRSSVYIVCVPPAGLPEAIAIAKELRRNGISAEFSLKDVNVGKQLKSADACGALFAVFTGGQEAQNGMIKIKEMRTGEEIVCPVESAAEHIRKKTT
jgi:histidyl-tRNA synthetase